MKDINERVSKLEKYNSDLKIKELEDRIKFIENIIENKLGFYISKHK